jgi:hypothetical protein
MRPEEFFQILAAKGKKGTLELGPGPFKLEIEERDVEAARFLVELLADTRYQDADEILTEILHAVLHRSGQVIDKGHEGDAIFEDERLKVLLSAWWWMTFFTARADLETDLMDWRRVATHGPVH